MSSLTPNTWVPSGNDYVIDGLWGRLGIQENFGETYVSGATNGLAVKDTGDRVFLYAGSVNGGVHLRVYNKTSDTWSESWEWISKPGGSYTGSQSIGVLSISDDGKFLAVGQGNPNNYGPVGSPSKGIQIGAIQEDGSINWLATTEDASKVLEGENIRSMEWVGDRLVATSYTNNPQIVGSYLGLATSKDGINSAIKFPAPNLFLSRGGDYMVAAGYGHLGDVSSNVILTSEAGSTTLNQLTGQKYSDLRQLLGSAHYSIARTDVYERLVDNHLIAYAGLFSNKENKVNPIAAIVRLEIDVVSRELVDYSIFKAESNEIGTNQGSNRINYGNFSFWIDPFDPAANSIFVGGNQFGSSPSFPNPTSNGGLVRINFSGSSPTITDYLYGPKIDKAKDELVIPFSPGQPHADSRTIAFYQSASGPKLIQTDDGGVWQLELATSSTGSTAAKDAWWQSLTTKGLNTLETNMVSWASSNNSIASSYQDNSASLGYFGDDHATNFWAGDGQLAFFDEGGISGSYASYLSSQKYLSSGDNIVRLNFTSDGSIGSRGPISLYLQRIPDAALTPWDLAYNPRANSAFTYPTEANAYAQGAVVFTGANNIYQTIAGAKGAPENSLVLLPLLDQDVSDLKASALDNQDDGQESRWASLYVGGQNGNDVALYGRQRNSDSHELIDLFADKSRDEINAKGGIIDIAHKPGPASDFIYWIQGGFSIAFGGTFYITTRTTDQWLGARDSIGNISYTKLKDLGIDLIPNDPFGYQAIVFVPGNDSRRDQLILGGLDGAWSSELNPDGTLSSSGFTKLTWEGLPTGVGPGSYIKTIQYDPQDDLLIAGTQGQGSFLYSFSGELGERPASSQFIEISDLIIPQRALASVDKRGNQTNSSIVIQLNGQLKEPEAATEIRIVLHDAESWRKVIEAVSPYDIDLPSGSSSAAFTEAIKYANILDPVGLEYRGGYEENGNIIMPMTLPAGVSLYNLVINAKEFATPQDEIKLKYSVQTLDGLNSSNAVLRLVPDLSLARAVFTGSSFGGTKDYYRARYIPLVGESLAASLGLHSASSVVNAFTVTPTIASDLALLPTRNPLSAVRATIPIDSFEQLRSSDSLNSRARQDAWLQGLISNINAQDILAKDTTDTSNDHLYEAYAALFLPVAYDPTAGFGVRFYDLDGDGYADRLSSSGNASQTQFTDNVNLSFGSLILRPVFKSIDQRQIQLSDHENPQAAVSIRLSFELQQRSSSTSGLGYVIFDPLENLIDFSFTSFQDRARTLINSLGDSVDLSAIPLGTTFSNEILVNIGQRVMFFEVEGGSLSQLTSLDDPRLTWLDSSVNEDKTSLLITSANGAEGSLAIASGFQGINPLIADLQNQAPILDLTAFATDQIISGTLSYGREAGLDSSLGWYVITRPDGAITAANGDILLPDHDLYAQEALRAGNQIDALTGIEIANGLTSSKAFSVHGGVLLAPFAKVSNGETYFAFAEANSDHLEHFYSLGVNQIGFEDLKGGGDRDFQDLVQVFHFTADLVA